MKQKINLRLGLIALIAVIATTIGVTFIYYGLFRTRVKNDLHTDAKLLADTGLFQSLYREADGKAELINRDALTELDTDSIRITWISEDGTVLYDNDNDFVGLANHINRPEIQSAIKTGVGESMRKSDTMNLDTFYSAIKLNDGTILRVSTQARSISSIFLTAIPVILSIVFLILVLCIILGHMLTIQLMKPINSMAEDVEGSLDVQVYHELEPFAKKIRSQHEKILEAATIRQDFTANVSHELKTPLTAISGYAELLENHMIDEKQETEIAGKIRQNANRLLLIINDTIKLSELDHEELPKKFERVNLHELAEDCCKNLKVSANQNNVTLSCDGSDAIINGDADLLKELVENLVQNSIRYNRSGGWVKVNTYQEQGRGVLSVSDNGIGIPKDKQERVFERFYRVDKGRSRENGGTGLGLAIVKHIAEMHGAEIVLVSSKGEGTTVKVKF